MIENKNNEDIKQNITNAATQSVTERGSVTEGDEHLVVTRTEKHPLDVHMMAAIQFNNKRMTYDGADIAIQAAYDEVMERLYADDGCGDWHPYFNNWNARDPFNECR
jgi:hypothetical protein